MALVASGAIAFSDVNVELGFSSTATIALNDAAVRTLFGIASGAIAMSDGYGKSAFEFVEDVFSTYLYTGNDSTQTINNGINLAGKGGLVWLKSRNNGTAQYHYIFDSARGVGNSIYPNAQSQQNVSASDRFFSGGVWNSNGFTLTSDGNVNSSADRTVSWTFRKSPKFFDVVTYTGTGNSSLRINHSLGVVPGMIIIKRLSSTSSWAVFHRGGSSGLTSAWSVLSLNSSNAAGSNSNYTGLHTSTQFGPDYVYDSSSQGQNINGETYVAYLFAHNAGGFGATGTDNVISCGSFTGNTTVDLGYEPQWIMIKKTNAAGSWTMWDTMRGWSQTQQVYLYADLTNAESSSSDGRVPNATGFTTAGYSAGDSFIYMAIRRPMKVPTDATTVFSPVARTGTGSDAFVTTNFPPDLTVSTGLNGNFTVWVDKLRGANSVNASQITNPESYLSSSGTQVKTFDSTGITYGSTGNYTNTNGTSYINWIFRRAPKFFDIVCYTGTGSAGDVSHNLGAVPEMIIIRRRSGDDHWFAYHSGTALPNAQFLNLYAAAENNSTRMNTAPSSSTFNVRTDAMVNGSGSTYVAFLFATLAGVSKVGSYTGSTGVQQINCGFASGARFVMIKRTDSGANSGQEYGQWYCFDTARGIVTGDDPYISMNRAQGTQTGFDYIDPYSAGFELSYPANTPMGYPLNISGATYIYLAIA